MEGFDFDMPEVQIDFGEADIEMDQYGDVQEEGEEEEEEEKGRPRRPRQPQQQRSLRHMGVQIKDYFCCSVFNTMFCNCLFLGLLALVCSYQVRKRMAKRDLKGARQCSGHAYRTNTAAVVVTVCGLAIFFLCLYFNQ